MNRSSSRGYLTHAEAYDWTHSVHSAFPWARQSLEEIAAALAPGGSFPCSFARSGHRQRMLLYAVCGDPRNPGTLRDLRTTMLSYLSYMRTLDGIEESMRALLVLFEPSRQRLTAEEYNDQAWAVMQDWVDNDAAPWPTNIPKNPGLPLWSLCFGGTPIFVNVSSPGHTARRSRNLGSSLVLVTQPRAGFDRVAGDTPEGQRIRREIRRAQSAYDDLPSPDYLGTYHAGDLEWPQYALSDLDNEPPKSCPLAIGRASLRSA